MVDLCHWCGNEYKEIGKHWAWSGCDYERFSDHQHEIITGLLLGDGGLNWVNSNPYVQVGMTAPNYLEYLSTKKFPTLSGGVALIQTAEECATRDRKSGFNPAADKEDYSDLYKWQTMSHPDLQRYKSWYSTGSKVFPSKIELTPTALKHWYCGDGSLRRGSTPLISLSNEYGNEDKIVQIFNRAGFTDFRLERRAESSSVDLLQIVFSGNSSERFFNYVSSPPPDFAYKWK